MRTIVKRLEIEVTNVSIIKRLLYEVGEVPIRFLDEIGCELIKRGNDYFIVILELEKERINYV